MGGCKTEMENRVWKQSSFQATGKKKHKDKRNRSTPSPPTPIKSCRCLDGFVSQIKSGFLVAANSTIFILLGVAFFSSSCCGCLFSAAINLFLLGVVLLLLIATRRRAKEERRRGKKRGEKRGERMALLGSQSLPAFPASKKSLQKKGGEGVVVVECPLLGRR